MSGQVPAHTVSRWLGRTSPACVVIPVINEGERIALLLGRMARLQTTGQADILIVDGGSQDGSLDAPLLDATGVR